jgi:hypothetical protein
MIESSLLYLFLLRYVSAAMAAPITRADESLGAAWEIGLGVALGMPSAQAFLRRALILL